VDALRPRGMVLELAGGTGLWTSRLSRHAERLVAVDSSPVVIERNRERTNDRGADYVVATFSWEPQDRFGVVSLLVLALARPPDALLLYWALVRRSPAPGGRAIFIDNLWGDETHPVGSRPTTFEQARTDAGDGHRYQIVTAFYEQERSRVFEEIGWHAEIMATGRSFLLGWAQPVIPSSSRRRGIPG